MYSLKWEWEEEVGYQYSQREEVDQYLAPDPVQRVEAVGVGLDPAV